MNKEIIFPQPVLVETLWGGDRLKEFNYTLQSNHVGECWAVSAHKKGDNLVLSDKYKGLTLSQLYNEHRDIFGNISYEEFPLLTKIIDAKEDLSVQVHPNDEYAMKTENSKYGKTECWYIIDAKSNAKIIIGHNASSKTELKEMINKGEWNNFLREVSVKKGDFFFIPAGTVHAIKGGTLILETQQSIDITYRVYDYDRLQNGKPRELHIKQSIDVIDAPFINQPTPLCPQKTKNNNLTQLCSCDLFSVWKADVKDMLELEQDQNFMIVSVIEGSGLVDDYPINKGAHFIIPFNYGKVVFKGNFELIISSC